MTVTKCRQFPNYGRAGYWSLLKMGQCEWRPFHRGGDGDDGWFFTHNVSGTAVINGCVRLLQLSHTHTSVADSHSHTGPSADLFPLALSSAEIWTSDKMYKQDVSLSCTLLVLLLFSLFYFLSVAVSLFQSWSLFSYDKKKKKRKKTQHTATFCSAHAPLALLINGMSSLILWFVTLMKQMISVRVSFYSMSFIQQGIMLNSKYLKQMTCF